MCPSDCEMSSVGQSVEKSFKWLSTFFFLQSRDCATAWSGFSWDSWGLLEPGAPGPLSPIAIPAWCWWQLPPSLQSVLAVNHRPPPLSYVHILSCSAFPAGTCLALWWLGQPQVKNVLFPSSRLWAQGKQRSTEREKARKNSIFFYDQDTHLLRRSFLGNSFPSFGHQFLICKRRCWN